MKAELSLLALVLSACATVPAAATSPPSSTTPVTDTRQLPPGADRVVFGSRDPAHTTIDGLLFRPPGSDDAPHAAVVLLHGCAGSFDKDGQLAARDHEWALRLVAQGYVVLLPDSFARRGVRQICTASEGERSIRPSVERVGDAYGALVYLQAQPFVHADRIAIMGWSHGAMTVLNAIARVAPARPQPLAHDFRVAVAFYPGCSKVLRRDDWAPPIVPLLMLSGESDDWTPIAPCQELVAEAPSQITLQSYPGAYHDFDAPDVPVHTRHNIASTRSHTATIGTDPAARADAIARVTALFTATLH